MNRSRRAQSSTARPCDGGFTLIELLVVVLIIGVLAGIATPVFLNQRKKAVDASLRADVRNAASTAETLTVDDPAAANFGSSSAAIRAAFTAAGFKRSSTGNDVVISGTPQAGFCVRAFNPTSSAPDYYTAYWWDSLKGGPQPRGGRPAGGACDNWLDTGFITLG